MTQYGRHFVVVEIGDKFVVVHRELWRTESESSLATLIGKSILYSVHPDRASAEAAAKSANDD